MSKFRLNDRVFIKSNCIATGTVAMIYYSTPPSYLIVFDSPVRIAGWDSEAYEWEMAEEDLMFLSEFGEILLC